MKNLGELLSEIYFHELDTRERIFNRLQLNFAIYASVIGVLAYMARTIDYGSKCPVITLFYVGLFFSIILISISIYLSINSLTGFEYKIFPKSNEMLNYREKITDYAKSIKEYNDKNNLNNEIPDPEKSTNQYALESLAECIDHNTKINEYRRKGVRRSVWFIILSAVPILFSAVLFIGFDLDASSPRKNNQNISSSFNSDKGNAVIFAKRNPTEQTTMEESTMSSDKKETPPPPPAPEKPKLQISTEDLKTAMPKKSKILNEDK